MANRDAEFTTIEDSRYTMEQVEKEGLITPPKNWMKMHHDELVMFFRENNIKMHKKPKHLRTTF